MLDRPKEIDPEAVTRANIDLSERIFREGLSIVYDDDGDTLLLTIGEGAEAITQQFIDGIYVRIHPVTLKIVGCTIVGLVSDIFAHNKAIRKLFADSFERFRSAGGREEWKGLEAQRVLPLFEVAISHRV